MGNGASAWIERNKMPRLKTLQQRSFEAEMQYRYWFGLLRRNSHFIWWLKGSIGITAQANAIGFASIR